VGLCREARSFDIPDIQNLQCVLSWYLPPWHHPLTCSGDVQQPMGGVQTCSNAEVLVRMVLVEAPLALTP
jgi:hypothetical protein